ncbi:MaoC family dehydratase N-terminal domain-containing protein (plasmid) [Natrinema zhouii]|uniref:FAS1-like dehydratase domain-containing protein n=1 Tax=Natrinema zhouii TaxID=1710539 RepID=UPI001CFF78A8|nr:MaoC family dehydratase N-terminal domain-containing protein [Natrinema zhouii]UHQ98886.1 MaoC family dehydratase N-terminal domain-containing protein [Natrinema zhouii]
MPEKSMAELESLVGERRQTVTDLTVEAGKVAEFARAIESQNEMFYDGEAAREAGYDDVPAPLTFTRVAYFPRYRVGDDGSSFGFNLGFDPERTVHGEQEYEYSRPVTVGDTLDGTTELVDVYQKPGTDGTLTFAVLETTYTDADGEVVVIERRTRIEREAADSQ